MNTNKWMQEYGCLSGIFYGPKIKKFIEVWVAILKLLQSTGDNIEHLGKELEDLLKALKQLKK